ncbi:MAG: glycerate kinase [Oscillospiraceae bacterium]|nr:glycerate kinase [Oscillospiraceae bacterium]
MSITQDAYDIINESIEAVLPDEAIRRALGDNPPPEGTRVIAIGKAAWRMASAAYEVMGSRITRGLIITKYGHAGRAIPGMKVMESGHPIPDVCSVAAADRALELVRGLTARETVLLLISGGGSALFEKPLPGVTLGDMREATDALLRGGADIREINAVRKHLSAVKGGRFALACEPARVRTIALSDVLGDAPDVIASGPGYPDESTCEQARAVLDRFGVCLSEEARAALEYETPKALDNATVEVIGSVAHLCEAAARAARRLGYNPLILSTTLDAQAREAGAMLAAIAREIRMRGRPIPPPCAIIAGGETVVNVRGGGKGGRNQELALAAAIGIDGLAGTVIFSVGSDGTDGPTDAAGGIVDGGFAARCRATNRLGGSIADHLNDNDSYPLLRDMGGLIITGPTGTNVNDLSCVLVR